MVLHRWGWCTSGDAGPRDCLIWQWLASGQIKAEGCSLQSSGRSVLALEFPTLNFAKVGSSVGCRGARCPFREVPRRSSPLRSGAWQCPDRTAFVHRTVDHLRKTSSRPDRVPGSLSGMSLRSTISTTRCSAIRSMRSPAPRLVSTIFGGRALSFIRLQLVGTTDPVGPLPVSGQRSNSAA